MKTKTITLLLVCFFLAYPIVSSAADQFTFDELRVMFRKKLPRKQIAGYDHVDNPPYKLGDKLEEGVKLEYSYKEPADRRAVRLFTDNNRALWAKVLYVYDTIEDSGFVSDYDGYKYDYGEPIKIVKDPKFINGYAVFDIKDRYVMMGYYSRWIYYVAEIDKKFVH